MNRNFNNAQQAFEYYYDKINQSGEIHGITKRLEDVGFYITNPLDNSINTHWRKWNARYAEREWEWYLSGNRSVEEIKKYAPIWDKMHNGNNIVNSNYGYQWNRRNQLEHILRELMRDKTSRRAWITILDTKEHSQHKHDTPCTLSIGFTIKQAELNMKVLMRSNDLWYGFCNDQYCFSMLQKYVATQLGLAIGTYFHYAADLHLYKQQQNLKTK